MRYLFIQNYHRAPVHYYNSQEYTSVVKPSFAMSNNGNVCQLTLEMYTDTVVVRPK